MAAQSSKKGRKVGRNKVKCERYRGRTRSTGKRIHNRFQRRRRKPVTVVVTEGSLLESVPARVSHGALAIPYSRFREADFAEVCAHLGITVLT